jgi:hypothetical protein
MTTAAAVAVVEMRAVSLRSGLLKIVPRMRGCAAIPPAASHGSPCFPRCRLLLLLLLLLVVWAMEGVAVLLMGLTAVAVVVAAGRLKRGDGQVVSLTVGSPLCAIVGVASKGNAATMGPAEGVV